MRSLVIAACLAVGVGVGGVFAVACSSTSDSAAPTADGGDAGAPDVIEAGPQEAGLEQDPNVYPAQHQPIPLMTLQGKPGLILAKPRIITVTFAGDSRRDAFRAFDDVITTTDYWKKTMSGFGVGTGSGGLYAELPPFWSGSAHVALTDDQIEAMLQDGINHGLIPPPTTNPSNDIYAFYFPKNVAIADGAGSSSCAQFLAYHSATSVTVPLTIPAPPGDGGVEAGTNDGGTEAGAFDAGPSGPPINTYYAVMPQCDAYPNNDAASNFDQVTVGASHEFAEASSDPDIFSGYRLTTDDSWLPSYYPPGSAIENGDACFEVTPQWTEGKYAVQRIWSNAAAMAGEQPCQPVPAGSIYFGAAVRTTKQNAGSGSKFGYLFVKRGTTATAVVDVFSNAALQHDMLLYAGGVKSQQSDPSDLADLNDEIQLSLSRQSAHNGNAVILSVSVPDDASRGDFRMVVRAVYDMDYNDWPLILHVQ